MLNFADINDMGNGGYPGVISGPPMPHIESILNEQGNTGLPTNASLSEVPNDSTISSGFDEYNGNIAASETGGVVNVEWFYNQIVNAIENQMKFNQSSADKQMAFERELFEENWRRQLEAYDTSYERAVASMKRAGLNPTLIGLGTLQAAGVPSVSTPSGASTSISSNSTAFNGLMSAIMENLYEVFKMNDAVNDWAKTFNEFIIGLLGARR